MTSAPDATTPPASTPPRSRLPWLHNDDVAYIAPMGIFLLLTLLGGQVKSLYVASYVAKTILAGAAIVYFWKHYTRIRWDHWGLGVVVGIVGLVQWVGTEHLLLNYWPDYPKVTGTAWNPNDPADPSWPFRPFATNADGSLVHFPSLWVAWAFVILRWAGAALVVPFMEELFWRDYLWRTILAPANFKLAGIGEWAWVPFVGVALAFSTVHVQWITAIGWGLMIAGLLVWTKSLGACIVAHAVTNLLLGAYVLYTGEWFFW